MRRQPDKATFAYRRGKQVTFLNARSRLPTVRQDRSRSRRAGLGPHEPGGVNLMSRSSVVPDEPTALALVVQDDKQTEAHRHAALESLDRLVIQRISSNLAPESDEFHQEALAFIWNRLAINRKFEPDRGRFEAW